VQKAGDGCIISVTIIPPAGATARQTVVPRALETFYRFLGVGNISPGVKPSLFLTDAGCIELCWEDSSGKAVQVEFRPAEIEFYLEKQDLEGSVPGSEAKELATRLAA